jgi:hypothetical protein
MTTAGGIVFHGEPDGNFQAYDARSGDLLWQFQTGFGADGPPMTYPPPAPITVTALTGAPVNIDQVSIGRLWDADNKELSANAERPASRHLSPWIKPAPTRTRVFHIPGCTAR